MACLCQIEWRTILIKTQLGVGSVKRSWLQCVSDMSRFLDFRHLMAQCDIPLVQYVSCPFGVIIFCGITDCNRFPMHIETHTLNGLIGVKATRTNLYVLRRRLSCIHYMRLADVAVGNATKSPIILESQSITHHLLRRHSCKCLWAFLLLHCCICSVALQNFGNRRDRRRHHTENHMQV